MTGEAEGEADKVDEVEVDVVVEKWLDVVVVVSGVFGCLAAARGWVGKGLPEVEVSEELDVVEAVEVVVVEEAEVEVEIVEVVVEVGFEATFAANEVDAAGNATDGAIGKGFAGKGTACCFDDPPCLVYTFNEFTTHFASLNAEGWFATKSLHVGAWEAHSPVVHTAPAQSPQKVVSNTIC